jgi:ribonuclease P/MRP protein subunit RPP40
VHNAVDDLVAWADQWQLSINISKCHVLHLGRINPRNMYFVNNSRIPDQCDCVTDLGVEVDNGLKFNKHISNIITKANQRIAVLFRGFVSRNQELLVKAYVTFVRPVLEYASCVWSPVLITHVNAIERVQKYFTRRLHGMEFVPYNERLALLNLETLEVRRLHSDIIMYYKVIHNMVALTVDRFFHFDDRQLISIRSYDPNNLVKPMITSTFVRQNFSVRCIDAWNSIPIEIRNMPTVLSFKHALKTVNLTRFMIGSYCT